jgi:hypothetical protein
VWICTTSAITSLGLDSISRVNKTLFARHSPRHTFFSLENVLDYGYISPEAMVAYLSALTRELSLEFECDFLLPDKADIPP